MELLIMIDAMKEHRRQDYSRHSLLWLCPAGSKMAPRAPFQQTIADLITTAGANRVLSMDFTPVRFKVSSTTVDNLFATPVLLEYIKKRFQEELSSSLRIQAVSKGPGLREALGATLAIVDNGGRPNEAQVMNIIGDIKNKKVIILMI